MVYLWFNWYNSIRFAIIGIPTFISFFQGENDCYFLDIIFQNLTINVLANFEADSIARIINSVVYKSER